VAAMAQAPRPARGGPHTSNQQRSATMNQNGRVLPYLLLWMLGVPASLLIILFLLGVGR
jgi:hypothetical protein